MDQTSARTSEGLSFPQRLRVHAHLYPTVRIVLESKEALKLVSIMERHEQMAEEMVSLRRQLRELNAEQERLKLRAAMSRALTQAEKIPATPPEKPRSSHWAVTSYFALFVLGIILANYSLTF